MDNITVKITPQLPLTANLSPPEQIYARSLYLGDLSPYALTSDLDPYQLQPSEGAFVDGDKAKLDGIATGATADQDLSGYALTSSLGTAASSDITDFATAAQGATADAALPRAGGAITGEISFTPGSNAYFDSGSIAYFDGGTASFGDWMLNLRGTGINQKNITLNAVDPTANQAITFPDATGTVALTSDLSGYALTSSLGTAATTAATDYVTVTGNQSIAGNKTFTDDILGDVIQAKAGASLSLNNAAGISILRVGVDGSGGVAEGSGYASGPYSHAEGLGTLASGTASHAEGDSTITNGFASHAEGAYTIASGPYSHAEGDGNIASGGASHAEGAYTIASGPYSHAEGSETEASGAASHAEGEFTTASGEYSHAAGVQARAIHNGARVMTDSQNVDETSTLADQMTCRYANGYQFKGGDAVFTGEVSGSNLSGENSGDQDLSNYATLTGSETLTNKTLTSPTVETGLIVDVDALVVDSGTGNVGIGMAAPAAPLHIKMPRQNGVRELLFKAHLDESNAQFFINNGTISDGAFAPTFCGYNDHLTIWPLGFNSLISAAADASNSSSYGLIDFAAFRTTNAESPLNGTLSSVVNRKIMTVRTLSAIYFTVEASGNVGIGTATPSQKLDVVGNANVSGSVTVADDPYDVGWIADLSVPTKKSVYDKIDSLESLMTILAEDSANGLSTAVGVNVGNAGFQWSFGNGDETPLGSGIVLPYACRVVALSVQCEGSTTGTGVVAVVQNSTVTSGTVTISTGTTAYQVLETPIIFAAGDVINFKTIGNRAGTSARVAAFIKVKLDV